MRNQPTHCGRTQRKRHGVSIPEPVNVMSSRSIRIPMPPLGGIPYSIVVAEVFVQRHRVLITGSGEHDLRLETFSLHHRINQLESRGADSTDRM
jgi:hypothetical protein